MNIALDRPHPPTRAGEVLAAVHRRPGISRSELAAELGLSSGMASDLVARLAGDRLLSEGEPAARGTRGRPTRTLWPHPEGPLVAVAAIAHEDWRVEAIALGGEVVTQLRDRHDRDAGRVLAAVAGGAGRGLGRAWRARARLRRLGPGDGQRHAARPGLEPWLARRRARDAAPPGGRWRCR